MYIQGKIPYFAIYKLEKKLFSAEEFQNLPQKSM